MKLLLILLTLSQTATANYDALRDRAADQYRVPRELMYAIITIESNHHPQAINPKTNPGVAITSYGLGQLTKDTAWDRCRLKLENIYDPWLNLKCSAKVIRYQLDRFNESWYMAISAYNRGTPKCIGQAFSNQKYVDDVIAVLETRISALRLSKEEAACLNKSISK